MFAKLIKHEWRAVRGVIGLLCVIVLISGLTIGSTMWLMVHSAEEAGVLLLEESAASAPKNAMSESAGVICVLLIMASVAAIAVCVSGSCVFVIYRFYKRCFTDEGYLTFTLPVNNHQILLSSILICVLGVVLVSLMALLMLVMVAGMFLLAMNSMQTIVWGDVLTVWEEVRLELAESFRDHAGLFARLAFSGVFKAVGELIVLLLSVTIGAMLARKHKLLAAAGVYFGIGIAQSIVYSLQLLDAATGENVNRMLSGPGVMGLALSVCGYFLMHWLISKKLNLA